MRVSEMGDSRCSVVDMGTELEGSIPTCDSIVNTIGTIADPVLSVARTRFRWRAETSGTR